MLGQLVYKCKLPVGSRNFAIDLKYQLSGNYILKVFIKGIECHKQRITIHQ